MPFALPAKKQKAAPLDVGRPLGRHKEKNALLQTKISTSIVARPLALVHAPAEIAGRL